MKMVARMPSSAAAKATPCAWLPADAATTPRSRSVSFSWASRLYAPRILYDPVRCRFSAFRSTGTPSNSVRYRDRSSGVTSTTAETRSRAARKSARVGPVSVPTSGASLGTGAGSSRGRDDVGESRVRIGTPFAARDVADHDVGDRHERHGEESTRNSGQETA